MFGCHFQKFIYITAMAAKVAQCTVRMFMIIAIVILIIACINYVNLSTARSMFVQKKLASARLLVLQNFNCFFSLLLKQHCFLFFAVIISINTYFYSIAAIVQPDFRQRNRHQFFRLSYLDCNSFIHYWYAYYLQYLSSYFIVFL